MSLFASEFLCDIEDYLGFPGEPTSYLQHVLSMSMSVYIAHSLTVPLFSSAHCLLPKKLRL